MGPLGRIEILVVDDDRRIINLLRTILKSLGFEKITTALSAEEGLRILATHAYSIMIVDWEMPGMSGIDMIHTIRECKDGVYNQVMPAILLTGRAEVSDVLEARDMGATEFLAKPFTVETLLSRIISVIDRPRQFVIAPGYVGPDRRRIDSDRYKGPERRGD